MLVLPVISIRWYLQKTPTLFSFGITLSLSGLNFFSRKETNPLVLTYTNFRSRNVARILDNHGNCVGQLDFHSFVRSWGELADCRFVYFSFWEITWNQFYSQVLFQFGHFPFWCGDQQVDDKIPGTPISSLQKHMPGSGYIPEI